MKKLSATYLVTTIVIIVAIVFVVCFKFLFPLKKETPEFRCATCEREIEDSIDRVSKLYQGQKLFESNCASCHNASSVSSTGPGLLGVYCRIPNKKWAYSWTRNSDSVIKSGDPYANKIYTEYQKIKQPLFPTLTNVQIDRILEYCSHPGCISDPCK